MYIIIEVTSSCSTPERFTAFHPNFLRTTKETERERESEREIERV